MIVSVPLKWNGKVYTIAVNSAKSDIPTTITKQKSCPTASFITESLSSYDKLVMSNLILLDRTLHINHARTYFMQIQKGFSRKLVT